MWITVLFRLHQNRETSVSPTGAAAVELHPHQAVYEKTDIYISNCIVCLSRWINQNCAGREALRPPHLAAEKACPLPEGLPYLPLEQGRLQDVLRCPKRRGLPGLPLLETASMISATLTGSTIPATAVTMA